jgi:hypothetical protein
MNAYITPMPEREHGRRSLALCACQGGGEVAETA